MRHLKLAKKVRETNPEVWENLYDSLIIKKIRQRYSVDKELSIQRKRDSHPEEFAEYYAYVENCKEEVKKELEI